MIKFRCWYCNKKYTVADRRIGEYVTCTCERVLSVPKRNGGKCRVKTLADWLVEIVIYGVGGALLGFGFAILVLSRLRFGFWFESGLVLTAGLTIIGFVAGLLCGERGVNWIGRMIQNREDS